MENIHSLLTVSISEFKQNPSKVVEEAHGQPVAVLNHNRPAFYTVSPEFMAKMAELYDERQLESLVQMRLKSVSRAVKVNIDDL
ncbi:type II toxin-antitoxin system Phd/YefM family antitoxin [Cupriavidus basilensis]|uniref:type II toxin-antitoxin system Phd/YefM family antitoxin n=1 Tax=Cupriavidus basilensis TaxID=68895 RepID=UPI0020A683A7|nr:type II toxin-antitoxin system prevent-host-death family antitoxin [Cupriavidus basilensis]MCP3020014.1 type II toxin-antitoxin system prevent-host-death family antitoxin [Cupriavidus basilensis]MDR3382828.1 type II toxin-antitoxin system prevent-host-death family antitoxin [Cupriavidus basilensis]